MGKAYFAFWKDKNSKARKKQDEEVINLAKTIVNTTHISKLICAEGQKSKAEAIEIARSMLSFGRSPAIVVDNRINPRGRNTGIIDKKMAKGRIKNRIKLIPKKVATLLHLESKRAFDSRVERVLSEIDKTDEDAMLLVGESVANALIKKGAKQILLDGKVQTGIGKNISEEREKKHQKALEKSIVLIGPPGVGKSVMGRKVKEYSRDNLPIVMLDVLRYCPATIEEIKANKANIMAQLDELRKDKNESIRQGAPPQDLSKNSDREWQLKNDLWNCEMELNARTLFPNVPNYEEMGLDRNFIKALDSPELKRRFPPIFLDLVWHMYVKQFETKLLDEVVKQIDTPCIVDTGGGMPIALEREYQKCLTILSKPENLKFLESVIHQDPAHLIEKYLDPSKAKARPIQTILQNFKNIVYIKMPEKNELMPDSRAERGYMLSKMFVDSGQYDKIATMTLDTKGLYLKNCKTNTRELSNGDIDENIAAGMAKTILNCTHTPIAKSEHSM